MKLCLFWFLGLSSNVIILHFVFLRRIFRQPAHPHRYYIVLFLIKQEMTTPFYRHVHAHTHTRNKSWQYKGPELTLKWFLCVRFRQKIQRGHKKVWKSAAHALCSRANPCRRAATTRTTRHLPRHAHTINPRQIMIRIFYISWKSHFDFWFWNAVPRLFFFTRKRLDRNKVAETPTK